MVETHRFFRFSLYGGDSPAFLGFHFMVETHLRQFLVYNKYMQFALKNQYNSIILQNINSIILPKYKPPKTKVLRGWKFFLKLYVPKRMINVLRTVVHDALCEDLVSFFLSFLDLLLRIQLSLRLICIQDQLQVKLLISHVW